MNIFVLDSDIRECARAHCDRHVVRMILEYSQLLSTAHRLQSEVPDDSPIYKATHKNHPCAVWVRESAGNYMWTASLLGELLAEYTRRYRKEHKSTQVFPLLMSPPGQVSVQYHIERPSAPTTPWPLCMPDEYKVPGDAVASYRNYYRGAKRHMARWKHTEAPAWFDEPPTAE